MVLTIKNEKYDVATSLGTAYEIESRYKGKKVMDIARDIDSMPLTELVDLLFFGFKKRNNTHSLQEFRDMIFDDDNFGYVQLKTEVIIYLSLIMSTDKTEEELRAEMKERIEKARQQAEDETEEEVTEENEKN